MGSTEATYRCTCTAAQVLLEPVAPSDPAVLGRIFEDEGVHFHEFQTKKKRKEAKAAAEEAKEEAILKGRTPEEAQMSLAYSRKFAFIHG